MVTAVHHRSGEQSCLRHEGQVILTAPSKKMGKLLLMLGTGGMESETQTDDVGKHLHFMTS